MNFQIVETKKVIDLKKEVALLVVRIKTGTLSGPTIAMIHECVALLKEMKIGVIDGLEWSVIKRHVDNAQTEAFFDCVFSKEV